MRYYRAWWITWSKIIESEDRLCTIYNEYLWGYKWCWWKNRSWTRSTWCDNKFLRCWCPVALIQRVIRSHSYPNWLCLESSRLQSCYFTSGTRNRNSFTSICLICLWSLQAVRKITIRRVCCACVLLQNSLSCS